MKTKLITAFVVTLLLIVSCTEHNINIPAVPQVDPKEEIAKTDLESYIANRSEQGLKLTDFKKTNGMDKQVRGVQCYSLEWEIILIAEQDIWKEGDSFVGWWYDFRVMKQEPRGFERIAARAPKFYPAGQRISLTGSTLLEQTENGWRVKEHKVG